MKLLAIVSFILVSGVVSGVAIGCPDFSGRYSASRYPGGPYYIYQQQGCEKIVAKYCFGSDNDCGSFQIWIDGKYRMVGDSDLPCNEFDCRAFSWKDNTLSVHQNASWNFNHVFPNDWNVECTSHNELWSVSSQELLITRVGVTCENGYTGDLVFDRMKRR